MFSLVVKESELLKPDYDGGKMKKVLS